MVDSVCPSMTHAEVLLAGTPPFRRGKSGGLHAGVPYPGKSKGGRLSGNHRKIHFLSGNSPMSESVEATAHFPACYVEFPEGYEFRRAAFYLAAEEYIAKTRPEGNYLFTWRLRPTVVMGRNQVAHQEIDLDFCRNHGIDVIRRKSGGGAIFADERNIMVSLVTGAGPVESLFEEYSKKVSDCLCGLGAPTRVSGRNDIILAGRDGMEGGKVCGNAFYHLSNRNIVHGTMLFDTNPELMTGALHPDVSKLKSAGVKSVRSRVALLKDYLNFGVERLQEALRERLTNITLELSEADVRAIEEIEAGYYKPEYLLGSSARAEILRGGRIKGCGKLEFHISLRGTLIRQVEIRGDYFEVSDAATAFAEAFTDVTFTPEALEQAVMKSHPERSIRGLDAHGLLHLLAQPLHESEAPCGTSGNDVPCS